MRRLEFVIFGYSVIAEHPFRTTKHFFDLSLLLSHFRLNPLHFVHASFYLIEKRLSLLPLPAGILGY